MAKFDLHPQFHASREYDKGISYILPNVMCILTKQFSFGFFRVDLFFSTYNGVASAP